MELLRLQARQVRRFAQGVVLDDLQPGLNLVHGPNESGKSTLVRALRAVFFERYGTTAVADLAPWGDSGASPEVEVEFLWEGQRWRLAKRFLKNRRCDLQIDGVSYSGERAEAKIASLLGFEYAGKGASSARHWGIPGLLWIEQGDTAQLRPAAEFASPHLRTALGSELGELASSAGDTVLAKVEALRGDLLTATGKPRGEYAQAQAQWQELQATLAALLTNIREYQDDVDRLAELERRHRQDEAQRPWLALREQQQAAAAQLADVAQWQAQLARQEDQRELQRGRLALLRQQLADRQQRRDERQRRQQALADHATRVESLTAAMRQHDDALKAARQGHQHAREQLRRARLAAERRHEREALALLQEQASTLGQRLDEARRLEAECQELQRQLQADTLTDDDLAKLKTLADDRTRLGIRRQQAATQLQFTLPDGLSLDLDGEPLAGSGERHLLHQARLRLPGGGELLITPGGTDLAKLERQWSQLEDDWQRQCRQLGVTSVAEAEERLGRLRQWRASLRQWQELLSRRAPQGVSAIQFEADALRERLAQRQQLLDDGADLPTDAPPLAEAEAAEAQADAHLRQAEQARQTAHTALVTAESIHQQARQEWEHAQAASAADDPAESDEDWQRRITDADTALGHLDQDIAARQAGIQAARPDILRQDVERLGRSAEQGEAQFRSRELQLAEQRSRLQALSAEGLDERRAELERDLAQRQRRHDELARRAAALDLLRDKLQARRQALTQRLQAPLRRHLERYLTLLFPQAEITLDEQLVPTRLTRPSSDGLEHGRLEELSLGAREQLGLISRLAYADLLREAGRPTLIVLDDALVHTDHDRLAAMKRVLFDAAQRHQILLLTCHPDSWRDLGVAPRDIASLPRPAA